MTDAELIRGSHHGQVRLYAPPSGSNYYGIDLLIGSIFLFHSLFCTVLMYCTCRFDARRFDSRPAPAGRVCARVGRVRPLRHVCCCFCFRFFLPASVGDEMTVRTIVDCLSDCVMFAEAAYITRRCTRCCETSSRQWVSARSAHIDSPTRCATFASYYIIKVYYK